MLIKVTTRKTEIKQVTLKLGGGGREEKLIPSQQQQQKYKEQLKMAII